MGKKDVNSVRDSPLFQAMNHALERFRYRIPRPNLLSLSTLLPTMSIDGELRSLLPPKHVAKALVDLYMGTFEKLHRVLHQTVFQHQLEHFWKNIYSGDLAWTATLIVVMRLGLMARPVGIGEDEHWTTEWMSRMETQSLQLVELYLHQTFYSESPSLPNLQIQCLVVMARLTDGSKPYISWKAAGSLLQTAVFMGLNHESSLFPGTISLYDAEIRRRLWTTILELLLRTSTMSDLPSPITSSDYRIIRPMNINDEKFIPCTSDIPVHPQAWQSITDNSFQRVLSGTLQTRLRLQTAATSICTVQSPSESVSSGEHCIACKVKEAIKPNNSPFGMGTFTMQSPRDYSLQRVFLSMTTESPFLHYMLGSFSDLTSHTKELLHECCKNILRLHQDHELDSAKRFIVTRWYRNDIITSIIVLCLALRASQDSFREVIVPWSIGE
jgi:hypothetical protein